MKLGVVYLGKSGGIFVRGITQLFADYRARIRISYLEVPWQQLLRQNKQREHSVPEAVIRRLLGKLEIPFYDEAHEVEYCIGE